MNYERRANKRPKSDTFLTNARGNQQSYHLIQPTFVTGIEPRNANAILKVVTFWNVGYIVNALLQETL